MSTFAFPRIDGLAGADGFTFAFLFIPGQNHGWSWSAHPDFVSEQT
ncbi:MAG: hypothetical protein JNL58_25915 [Planctomyces sp.]|nr:hypothetical protein [Planctomyces sp.]